METIQMIGGEDWLMRPVLRGLCRYELLHDDRFGLVDVMLMNEALDVEAENVSRVRRAARRG